MRLNKIHRSGEAEVNSGSSRRTPHPHQIYFGGLIIKYYIQTTQKLFTFDEHKRLFKISQHR